MATAIAWIALIAIVGWAIFYVVSRKKRSSACIGCSVENVCPSKQLYGACGEERKSSFSGVTPISIQTRKPATASAKAQAYSGVTTPTTVTECRCGC